MSRAACRDAPVAMFHPELPAGPSRQAWRVAAADALNLCAVCPVKGVCLADALATGDLGGVRGGHTPPELRELAGGRRRYWNSARRWAQ